MTTANMNPNRKGNESTTMLLIYLIAILISVLFLSSCKSPEKIMDKAYKTVATDIAPATEKRKAQLVSWVAANFPIRERTIEKEVTKVIVDTSQYQKFRSYIQQLNLQLSLANCPELNVDSIFKIAKETIKPDTIKTEKIKEILSNDTTGNWLREKKMQELISELAATKGQKKIAEDNLENEKIKSNKKDKWLWYFIASLVVLVLSHTLRSKLKIPFLK